jgi:hypothetical protein
LSAHVCYVSSTDRGDRLATVRLVGVRSDERWQGAGSADPLAVLSDVSSAAGWLSEQLAGREGKSAELPILCIDVEGANCTWLTSPSTDASVVAAALAHGSDAGSARVGGTWSTPTLAEASVEALAVRTAPPRRHSKPGPARGASVVKNGHAGPQRLAVLALPDVSARLLLDALDDRGISVGRVISFWHALAAAWDRSGGHAGSSAVQVVATTAPVMAIVLVDPAGRLLWAWSRGGQLLAAGTIRLPQDRHEMGSGMVRIGRAETGRLTADWLAWSVQLGVAPTRIVCVTPRTGVEEDSDDLTPAAMGAALGQGWPGASVDMAVHDDPIGVTLDRIMAAPDASAFDSRTSLTLLSHRPGRAHRSLYWWAAICLGATAVALAGIGRQAHKSGQEARAAGAATTATMLAHIEDTAAPANPIQRRQAVDTPRRYMEERLVAKRQAADPGLEPPKPILAELETLSYVLGTPEVEIDEISLLASSALVYVRVPNTATGEMIKASLDSVADSNCEWMGQFVQNPARRGQQQQQQMTYFLQGRWKTTEAPRGTTAAGGTGGRP